MFEEITNEGQTIAIIVRNNFHRDGIHFFTPNKFSQQLAYMSHPKGKEICPHVHKSVKREVFYTQETLFIKKGKLQVDFYSEEKVFINQSTLNAGDVILLIKGGHGFKVLEDVQMLEVKQGPYAGDKDKIKFNPA